MEEYIPKSVVLAEIKRIEHETNYEPFTDEVLGKRCTCRSLLSFLDTLEVKFQKAGGDGMRKVINAINTNLSKEPVSKELSEEIDYLSKQYPEVSFAKLSRIAVHVANWQKKQDQETIELAEDHAMLAGMVKGKEEMIEKACNYLHEHREEVKTEDNGIAGWISDEFIENFRKNMEE